MEEQKPPSSAEDPAKASEAIRPSSWLRRLENLIWTEAGQTARRPVEYLLRLVQVVVLAVQGFARHHCALRASALTYTTFLSMIPMLAVGFIFLKMFVQEADVTGRIIEFLAAGSGQTVNDAAEQITGYIEKTEAYITETKSGPIVVIATFALLLTAISMLATIEKAMNAIWGVARARAWMRRITDYLAVLIIAPLMLALLFTSVPLMTKMLVEEVNGGVAPTTESGVPPPEPGDAAPERTGLGDEPTTEGLAAKPAEEPDASQADPKTPAAEDAPTSPALGASPVSLEEALKVRETDSFFDKLLKSGLRPLFWMLPYVITWIIFLLVYRFVPNTKVPWRSAVMGGIVGGTLWQLAQLGYIQYSIAIAERRVNYIFGGFSWVLMLLVWAYLSWVILLFGAEIACAHQKLDDFRRRRRKWGDTPAEKETLALRLAVLLARPMLEPLDREVTPKSLEALSDELRLSPEPVEEMLELFERAGFARQSGDRPGAWLFCRSPHDVSILDVLRLARYGSVRMSKSSGDGILDPAAAAIREKITPSRLDELAHLPLERIRTFTLD